MIISECSLGVTIVKIICSWIRIIAVLCSCCIKISYSLHNGSISSPSIFYDKSLSIRSIDWVILKNNMKRSLWGFCPNPNPPCVPINPVSDVQLVRSSDSDIRSCIRSDEDIITSCSKSESCTCSKCNIRTSDCITEECTRSESNIRSSRRVTEERILSDSCIRRHTSTPSSDSYPIQRDIFCRIENKIWICLTESDLPITCLIDR